MEGDTNNIFRLKTDLRNAFKAINNSGTFAGWGALPTTLPAGFLVDGSREFDLPLSEGHVRQLIAKAHQVPSGRADETTTDGAVWEVTRDELFFLEPAWQGYLVDLSRQVAAELGVDEPIRLDFHRMLIMETGAMLKPRTDTERTPGMFGTLVICLPSPYTGGEVVVKHNDECKTLTTSDADQSFACWYSGVTHEVLPVRSGYRCVLTYNLAIRPSHDHTAPAASVLDSKKDLLRHTLERWIGDLSSSDSTNVTSHLYHALDQVYPKATASVDELKGVDFVRIRALQDFARVLPFEFFFAVLEQQKSGTVQRDRWRYNKRTRCYTDSESYDSHHEIENVEDTSSVVKSLRALDGTVIASSYDLSPEFCLVKNPFKGLEAASENYENEGNGEGSVTHWYRRSAIVIVPHVKLGEYLANCTFGPTTDKYERLESPGSKYFDSALRYLSRIRPGPPARMSMLDQIGSLFVSRLSKKLKMTDILKSALEYSHFTLFQTVSVHHKGRLPIKFFDWVREWLATVSEADRAEKYQKWIPLLIQGYPSMADSISIIERMSNPTGDDTIIDAAFMKTWRKDVIRRCVQSFPETNKKPTLSDAGCIVSAIFEVHEEWTTTSALLTSLFDRFPQADATAFLLDVLLRFKSQGQAIHRPISDIIELHKRLSSRVFNCQRRLSDIVTSAKAKLTSKPGSRASVESPASTPSASDQEDDASANGSSEPGLVVTPQALLQFACNLNPSTESDAVNSLEQFIQELTAQCVTFSADDMKSLWLPFLYQLIQAQASRSVSLNTTTYQKLAHQFVKHLDNTIIGPYPQVGVNFHIPHVDCTCTDCKGLSQFLGDTSQRVGYFRMAEHRRRHLKQQLDGAHIACTQETRKGGTAYTLMVTKLKTLQDEVNGWKKRQTELFGALTRHIPQEHLQSLLGAEEAARVQSLAEPQQPATSTVSHHKG
ncbi:hypothetical protein MJO28_006779 [Puccinia striiformis f. sp. tritici]|uniref:Prolyl 4-hydroxylase alpha subunit Fe(2+) 2OG dioxygenase domain-containing protein n=4 Tax=Puccinia striiformis TaxID=27350 RepID=A0A0L0VLD7_9BASI|nr:hypothetical protein MJO28_006779 [Puccinia striiformis f. sp. tritici]KAI9631132.1 hypothetical protein KEM48_013192 [Puccinia striiformis f. sp. tritici PST-130]KAI9631258.1 hypothetical protein KEM48_013187 [Puccinia striiformis f. sp. tritici PST-130]KNF00098.1 hypothetical protein PSTG_06719 [Puccinia striiformis f. sp. tritici PST-78]POW09940.1 hypothetical protein PSHT_08884 [Puccinia striiformis]